VLTTAVLVCTIGIVIIVLYLKGKADRATGLAEQAAQAETKVRALEVSADAARNHQREQDIEEASKVTDVRGAVDFLVGGLHP
jgi:hypothetical protein